MDRLRIAAAACAAVGLFGAAGTARADDGLPVAPDPTTVADTAVAIAGQAAGAADPGQYQPDTGQYQAPVGNINVSVRVLSPGDDGAVDQAISVAQPAPATAAPSPSVSISVNVNVTTNRTIVFPQQSDTGQYHVPGNGYHDPVAISADISAAIAQPALPSMQAPTPEQPPVPAAPTLRDRWGAAVEARLLAAPIAPAPVHRKKVQRGTHHRPAVARTPPHRAFVPAPAATSSPPPPAAWPAAARAVTRSAPPHGSGGTRPRPAGPPVPPRPSTPEQYSGAAASGGASFSNVLQTLGLLVASLWVAALGSARRLGDQARRLRGIVGPRPAKPG